jgi:SAM-dependent methyltransferase
MNQPFNEYVAELYDVSVPDWPGEIDYYRALARHAKAQGAAVLEIACGTGRVALRLAQDGIHLTGIDLSPAMLDIARQKSAEMPNVRWLEADMRSFELGDTFGLAIIPGHSFQFMLTPEDQVACLACIRRHLDPNGLLVVHLDHLDVRWLGDLRGEKRGVFEPQQEVEHPRTGRRVCTHRAWRYEPSTQTASVVTVTEELDARGQVVQRRERGPVAQHCVFRFEMEHLLARSGFQVEGVYGDFYRADLQDDSSEMIWLARVPCEQPV